MARKKKQNHGTPVSLTYDAINRPWVVYADGFKKLAKKSEALAFGVELAANSDCEGERKATPKASLKMDDSTLAQARVWLGFLEAARGENKEDNEALQAFDTIDILLSPSLDDDKALLAKQKERLGHCEQYAFGQKLLGTLQGLLLRRQVSFHEWGSIFRRAIEGDFAGGKAHKAFAPPSSFGPSLSPLSQGVLPPLQGRITSRFGEVRQSGRTHKGVDIAVPVGTSIAASWNGKVAKVGEDDGYGRFVVVDYSWRDVFGREPGWFDDSHVEVLYAHLSEVALQEDQVVRPGDVLALSGASGRVRGEHGGAHLHLETKLVQDVTGFSDAELVVDPLWLFSEKSITQGEPGSRPQGQSSGLVQQGAFQTSSGDKAPPGARVNVVVTDSGDVVIGGSKNQMDADVQLPLPGTSSSSHTPQQENSHIQMASYTPPSSGESISRRERVPAPFQEVPKDQWGLPKLPEGKELPKHKKGKPAPAPVPPPKKTSSTPDFFKMAPPKGVQEFMKPENLQKTAVQAGEVVVEHGPTALEVGGQLVALGGGATAAVATAALQPEIAIPAAAIGAAGGGAAALGKALKGQKLDSKAVVDGAVGVADTVAFFNKGDGTSNA